MDSSIFNKKKLYSSLALPIWISGLSVLAITLTNQNQVNIKNVSALTFEQDNNQTTSTTVKPTNIQWNDPKFNIIFGLSASSFAYDWSNDLVSLERYKQSFIDYINNNIAMFFTNKTNQTTVKEMSIVVNNQNLYQPSVKISITYSGLDNGVMSNNMVDSSSIKLNLRPFPTGEIFSDLQSHLSSLRLEQGITIQDIKNIIADFLNKKQNEQDIFPSTFLPVKNGFTVNSIIGPDNSIVLNKDSFTIKNTLTIEGWPSGHSCFPEISVKLSPRSSLEKNQNSLVGYWAVVGCLTTLLGSLIFLTLVFYFKKIKQRKISKNPVMKVY